MGVRFEVLYVSSNFSVVAKSPRVGSTPTDDTYQGPTCTIALVQANPNRGHGPTSHAQKYPDMHTPEISFLSMQACRNAFHVECLTCQKPLPSRDRLPHGGTTPDRFSEQYLSQPKDEGKTDRPPSQQAEACNVLVPRRVPEGAALNPSPRVQKSNDSYVIRRQQTGPEMWHRRATLPRIGVLRHT